MLLDIFKQNKIRISVSYFFLVVEFTLFSLLPYFLGKTVDSFANDDYTNFYIYIFVDIIALVMGFIRRIFDNRVFLTIWADKSAHIIVSLINRGIDSTNIISRTHMIGEFLIFLERYLPETIQAGIEILIALILLWNTLPFIGFLVLIFVIFGLFINYLYANKLISIENVLQRKREDINKTIESKNIEKVNYEHKIQRDNNIWYFKWESISWASTDVLNIVAIIIILLSIKSYSPGMVLTSILCCDNVFKKVMSIAGLFKHYKQLNMYKEFLNE